MIITILCSDPTHPVNDYIRSWIEEYSSPEKQIKLVRRKNQAKGGDLLFLVSCNEMITADVTDRYHACLVLHASDLPEGRGWSPHIWEISSGASSITVSLLEADAKVDSGRIWEKTTIPIPPSALWDEINDLLFQAELKLMEFAVENFETITPQVQDPAITPTYWPRRSPADSRIETEKSIADQFDLIRVCDPNRFPAYFELRGETYTLKLEKVNDG
ncbi:formyltransferase family protein [Sulfitobacter sp. 1A13679]|uniref:formyltransferase family protein n=1 Tax=Sulfitobacter sp. 1A13679 TaxID=3368597 RepID=UPI003746E423